MKLNEEVEDRVPLRVFETWYEIDDSGGYEEPLLYCKCRDEDREPWLVIVENFDPYFHVPLPLCTDTTIEALRSNARVTDVSMGEKAIVPYNRREEVHDEGSDFARTRTVRVETQRPMDVPKLREEFEMTGEADVHFDQRFLVDVGVRSGMTVPRRARSAAIEPGDIEPCNDHPVTQVRPRICYYDIEVQTSDSGPAVVSEKGTGQARNPITAIAAYDNYDDETSVFVLANDSWSEVPETDDGRVFTDETDMLETFCTYLKDRRPDVLTGWNSSTFDDPYFVNRCFREDVTAILSVSPTSNVSRMSGDGSWRNSDLYGILLFDMLEGYSNISRRELNSYSLGNVAEAEGLSEKLDVDEQHAYVEDPQKFIKYVKRDAELLYKLNEKREIL